MIGKEWKETDVYQVGFLAVWFFSIWEKILCAERKFLQLFER